MINLNHLLSYPKIENNAACQGTAANRIPNTTPASMACNPAANINQINLAAYTLTASPLVQLQQVNSKCMYDNNIITEVNKSNYKNVCANPDCVNEYLGKCKNIFNCGHVCNGLKEDSNYIRCELSYKCLVKNCIEFNNFYGQELNSLCPICLTDPLQTYSIVLLPCKHYVHKRCFKTRLELKWHTKEINFSFIKCPLCNIYITPELVFNPNDKYTQFTNNKEIFDLFLDSFNLFETVKKIAQIVSSDLQTNEQLKNPNSEIEIDKFSFYICDKCGNPFYGGLRECTENQDDDLKPLKNDHDLDVDLNKKLCLDCFDYSKIKGVTNCEIHGRRHIQFKCKFCCNISSHFCFGTTHFCEDCHIKQIKGDYLTQKDPSELSKCEGPGKCPLDIDHPENGEEFGMCCLLCIK